MLYHAHDDDACQPDDHIDVVPVHPGLTARLTNVAPH